MKSCQGFTVKNESKPSCRRRHEALYQNSRRERYLVIMLDESVEHVDCIENHLVCLRGTTGWERRSHTDEKDEMVRINLLKVMRK